MNFFYSSKFEKKFSHLRLPENRKYALAYHLQSVLPRGGIVEVFPGPLLKEILPAAALERGCKIKCYSMRHELANLKLLTTQKPDLVLIEPLFFVQGGALISPGILQTSNLLIGVGSVSQWTTKNPATHDFVSLTKIVSEIGVFAPEQFEQEIKSFVSQTRIP